jgi:hypothetical protein
LALDPRQALALLGKFPFRPALPPVPTRRSRCARFLDILDLPADAIEGDGIVAVLPVPLGAADQAGGDSEYRGIGSPGTWRPRSPANLGGPPTHPSRKNTHPPHRLLIGVLRVDAARPVSASACSPL